MRACRHCNVIKAPEAFPRLPCNERSRICQACKDEDVRPRIGYVHYARIHVLRLTTDWLSLDDYSVIRDIKKSNARGQLNDAWKMGQVDRRKRGAIWEYKITDVGAKILAKIEARKPDESPAKREARKPGATAAKREARKPGATPVKREAPRKFDPRPYFAWLDLCANERPDYNDNRRYVPDTSGHRSFVI